MAEVRALQDVGQFTASIDELREILAVRPDDPEASYRLGVALVQTGEASRAVWPLEKAAESPDYTVQASLLLASVHFANQNFEAVVKAADRVLEVDPDRIVALKMRAKGNLGASRLDAAMADTQRLLETEPDDYSVNLLYATILTDSGKLDEAEAASDHLKEIGAASGDPGTATRACLAPAMFAKDVRKSETKAREALRRLPREVSGERLPHRRGDEILRWDRQARARHGSDPQGRGTVARESFVAREPGEPARSDGRRRGRREGAARSRRELQIGRRLEPARQSLSYEPGSRSRRSPRSRRCSSSRATRATSCASRTPTC